MDLNAAQDFVTFLNKNAGVFSVVFSFVVTAATVVYAWLTWNLVAETRTMRRAQTDPSVSIALSPHPFRFGFVDLLIMNEGVGPAYDVAFAVEPSDEADAALLEKLNGLGFVRRGLRYMSPHQEIRTFFASMIERDERRMNTNLKVTVSFRGATGPAQRREYLLDFSPFWGYGALGEHPLVGIEGNLGKIVDRFQSLGSSSHRFQVRVYSPEDEGREETLTWLYPKLNRLSTEDLAAVEALVDGRLKSKAEG